MTNHSTFFYLSLGSNIGDRESFLRQAIEQLEASSGIEDLRYSSLYETEPVGKTEQALFLNIVVEGQTILSSENLLITTKSVERKTGRTAGNLWGPREIDIDILYYGHYLIQTEELIIPHKEIPNRRFVLEPLDEINPYFFCPKAKKPIRQMLALCPETPRVKRIKKFNSLQTV